MKRLKSLIYSRRAIFDSTKETKKSEREREMGERLESKIKYKAIVEST